MTSPEPVEPDAFFLPEATPSPETTAAGRALYWHVFGGPIAGATRGANNFALVTAGPVTSPATSRVTETSLPGTQGETFTYLGTFTHDPSDQDLSSLKPKAFR